MSPPDTPKDPQNLRGEQPWLNGACRAIKEYAPDNTRFILICATEGEGGSACYASDMARESAINVLKEILLRAGHQEDWMKHL